jgi:hypothetical protein
MILKCAAFLFAAVALAGCCASGTGCYAPLSGSPVAGDGQGPATTGSVQAAEFRPRKISRPKKEIVAGPIGDVPAEPKSPAKDEWEQQEAADRADEARLAKQLIICRGCSPPPATRDDDATGSVPR